MKRALLTVYFFLSLMLKQTLLNAQPLFNTQLLTNPENAITRVAPSTILKATDGGHLIFGHYNDFTDRGFIVKTDSVGNFVEGKGFSMNDNDFFKHIKSQPVADGVLSVFHNSGFIDEQIDKIVLVKSDNDTRFQWAKTFTIAATNIFVSDAAVFNNGILLTGYIINEQLTDYHRKMFLLRLDLDGNVVWSKFINSEYSSWGVSIVPYPDGSFLVGGQHGRNEIVGNSHYLISKFDAMGTPLWAKGYRSTFNLMHRVHHVMLGNHGEIILSGNRSGGFFGSEEWLNPELIKISETGEILDELFFLGGNGANNKSIFHDGHIYMFGNSLAHGEHPESASPFFSSIVEGNLLMKFDDDFNEVWSKTMSRGFEAYRPEGDVFINDANQMLIAFGDTPGNSEIPYLDFRSIDLATGVSEDCGRFEYQNERLYQEIALSTTEFTLATRNLIFQTEDFDLTTFIETPLELHNTHLCIESNAAPVKQFVFPDTTIYALEDFSFDFSTLFQDPDPDDHITYIVSQGETWFSAILPSWASFDPETLTLSGAPFAGNVGDYQFWVVAVDFSGNLTIEDFVVTIKLPNRAPFVLNSFSNISIREGKPFYIELPDNLFSDPDHDEINLSLSLSDGSELPEWMHWNGQSLSGTAPLGTSQTQMLLALTASDGELSSSITFEVGILANQSPSSFELQEPANGSVIENHGEVITFRWTASKDPDLDVVKYRFILRQGNEPIIAFDQLLDTTISLSILPANVPLTWQVSAGDGGISVQSEVFSLELDDYVLGTDNEIDDAWLVYPNPANHQVLLHPRLSGSVVFSNLKGEKILEKNFKSGESVDVLQLSPGLYLLKISTTQGTLHTKLVISR